MANQEVRFLLTLAATAQKFNRRPSDLIGIDGDAEPVVALAFDIAAAVRLTQEETEWNKQLFGGLAPAANANQPTIKTEYW